MMAVLPVNWSVIRLIQKNLLESSEPTNALYLAEIFLSRLLRSIDSHYDFVEGVREVLLKTIPISEAQAVGEEVAEAVFQQLPPEVQERVNADISRRFGEALSYFEAFLIPDLPWGASAASEIFPFARVGRQVLEQWGEEYAAWAEELAGSSRVSDADVSEIPFELPTFSFEVITVNDRGEEIDRRPGEASYHREELAEGVFLDMVSIPGGTFWMGAAKGESQARKNEKPRHQVTIEPFFMGKFAVTQAQWREIAALPRINRNLKLDPSRFKGDDRPIERVSWHDAIEFCDRLNRKTGQQYRLPSEAEWEYACRAGTTTPFHFGETITTDLVNYDGDNTYANAPKGAYREQTIEVGRLPPNAFGLYDMHGNVWEWCADPWHDSYTNAPADGQVWEMESDRENTVRVLRGGSWYYVPWGCRAAYRYGYGRSVSNIWWGFRLASFPLP
jgi:formylglycine-generating enzyme required for sulfatase activity